MIEKYHLIFEIIYWMLFQFWKFYFNNYIQSVTFINNNSIYLRNELHIFSKICTSSNNEFVCELRNYATCRSRITFGITLINWTFRQTCIWNAPLGYQCISIKSMVKLESLFIVKWRNIKQFHSNFKKNVKIKFIKIM